LTHRDSMIQKGKEGSQGDDFFRMKRGDVQFTTGGKGTIISLPYYTRLNTNMTRDRTLRTE
jgi:hypothetical protein